MSNCKVIALTNQKGGVAKTTTAVNLGVGLAKHCSKALLIVADAQANLTMALGYNRPDDIPITISTVMQDIMGRLSDRFGGTESGDLASVLMETAENAVEDNLPDYLTQLKDCIKDSFLEELDDFNIEVIYKRLAINSVAFMLA